MDRGDDFDDQRGAQINERIAETFEFVRDVIDDPAILEDMPDESEIDSRHVAVGSHTYHIVVCRSESGSDRWVARTTGRTDRENVADRRFWIQIKHECDASTKAAMNTVESALRAAAKSSQIAHPIA